VDAGLTEALAARQLGEARRSRDALERVLQLAEPDGYRRAFSRSGAREVLLDHLDSGTAYWSFVADLLSAATARTAPVQPDPGTGELLTDRELAVLRYLPSMLSNVEIATSLCLSVNTVKTHVRHIYRKLHATRRREAVRRARELHLI
jgi:LuxR family maltose regulon positive regulatory protein